tara:strand:+ start:12052 stop:13443 length:1392 start_codon:yes stop_codon:yes gene_type:complete
MSKSEITSIIGADGKFNKVAFDAKIKRKIKELIDKKPLREVRAYIDTEIENSIQTTGFTYKFACFVEDGAYAISRAIESIQGYTRHGKDGPSEDTPQSMDVQFADGSRLKVPWGTIQLPMLGDDAEISMSYSKGKRTMSVSGQCENRFVELMDSIMDATQKLLNTDSIYAGKAIKLGSDLVPHFMDLSEIPTIPMYLSAAVKFSLQPIIARIEQTELCITKKIPLKYSALMHGDYGTGKTLLAFNLGYKAIQNNWGFIYLTDPTKSKDMMQIAGQLAGNGNGVLTFTEDIDLVLKGERNTEMNELLNGLDGGDNKNKNIISVWTTNHLSDINRTFMRGKRTGTLITMGHLDLETATEFITNYFGDTLVDDPSEAAAMAYDLKIVPAFMAEILERVSANMVFSKDETTTTSEIIASIQSYKVQMEIARTSKNDKGDLEQFVKLVSKLFIEAPITESLRELDLVD